GQELYSLFGHTALRIIDSTNHTDIVYNWGTFDFDEPNFYVNFMRGQLNYFISAWNFPDFMYEYEQEQRNVYEQKLMLSCLDKQKIVAATLINMQGSNRYYKYDFLLDNCTNRVRDIILKQTPQTTFPFTGPLLAGATTPVNLGNYNFPATPTLCRFWTSQPNGANDPVNSNDTRHYNYEEGP
ncbi:MAG: DUF4105 domain-containing protein, partial [Chitinophagia bacterium]|nr:DUF4105 domain-containing protein [Chitinophagia bacterium]